MKEMDVLYYYFCPLTKIGSNGCRISNVQITRISTDTVKVSCPEANGDARKTIEFEILESDLLHPCEHNVYVECIRTFCNINTKMIERININDTVSLGAKTISIDKDNTIKGRSDLSLVSREIEDYDNLVSQYVKTNDYRSFLQMHKDIGLFISTDKKLADRFSFCKKTITIQKVFEILRYDFLVCNNLIRRNFELEPILVGWVLFDKLKQFDFLLDDELFDDFSYSNTTYISIRKKQTKK